MKTILFLWVGLLIAFVLTMAMNASALTTASVQYGGTATSSFLYGLLGSNGGTTFLRTFATSSLRLLTTDVIEGSKLFYTDARVGSYVSGSTTIPHIGGAAFGDMLEWSGSAWTVVATSTLGISGGASVAGSDTEVQFNNGGTQAGSQQFTWASSSGVLALGGYATSSILQSGGNLYLLAGTTSKSIFIYAGDGRTGSTAPGNMTLQAGTQLTSSGFSYGTLTLRGGSLKVGGVHPNNLVLDGGSALAVGVEGGGILLQGGTGSTTGSGGNVTIAGGTGGISGSSGTVEILGSQNLSGNTDGGSIVLAGGLASGSGANGSLYFCKSGTTFAGSGCVLFDTSALTISARTWTIQNRNGTVPLLEAAELWSGFQQFAGASSTQLSSYKTSAFGATATSTFNSLGVLTLATPLAISSGGTAAGSFTAGLPIVASADGSSLLSSTTLAVVVGGTGWSTINAHRILLGNDAAQIGTTSAGSAGQLLMSNGSSLDPSFAQYRSGTLHSFCTGVFTSAAATDFMPGFGGVTTICGTVGTTRTGGLTVSSSTIKYLRVKCGTAFKNTSGGITTVEKNGSSAGITCTVGTATSCSDTTHSATVADGDVLTISITTVTPSETGANCSVTLDQWYP